jgi:hypothetical protein
VRVALKIKITSDDKDKKADNIEDAHRKGTVLNKGKQNLS